MKTISTREFQLHLKDYIDGVEDLTLTKRDKVVGYFLHELPSTLPVENKPTETGTISVEKPIPEAPHVEITPEMDKLIVKNLEPEALWEDWNLMPVYKTGVPDQFCVTWHAKGERRTVYPIRKFRADGSVELEGNYCKDCIKEFLAKDGHLE